MSINYFGNTGNETYKSQFVQAKKFSKRDFFCEKEAENKDGKLEAVSCGHKFTNYLKAAARSVAEIVVIIWDTFIMDPLQFVGALGRALFKRDKENGHHGADIGHRFVNMLVNPLRSATWPLQILFPPVRHYVNALHINAQKDEEKKVEEKKPEAKPEEAKPEAKPEDKTEGTEGKDPNGSGVVVDAPEGEGNKEKAA